MKNTIILTIPFFFKGKEFTPSAEIDLDDLCAQGRDLDTLFHIVATENNIDSYSYEYEVLQSSEHHFSDATGIAENHLSEGTFDLEGFKENLGNIQVLETLQDIAKKTMDIENLEEHEKIKLALQKAYQAGKAQA